MPEFDSAKVFEQTLQAVFDEKKAAGIAISSITFRFRKMTTKNEDPDTLTHGNNIKRAACLPNCNHSCDDAEQHPLCVEAPEWLNPSPGRHFDKKNWYPCGVKNGTTYTTKHKGKLAVVDANEIKLPFIEVTCSNESQDFIFAEVHRCGKKLILTIWWNGIKKQYVFDFVQNGFPYYIESSDYKLIYKAKEYRDSEFLAQEHPYCNFVLQFADGSMICLYDKQNRAWVTEVELYSGDNMQVYDIHDDYPNWLKHELEVYLERMSDRKLMVDTILNVIIEVTRDFGRWHCNIICARLGIPPTFPGILIKSKVFTDALHKYCRELNALTSNCYSMVDHERNTVAQNENTVFGEIGTLATAKIRLNKTEKRLIYAKKITGMSDADSMGPCYRLYQASYTEVEQTSKELGWKGGAWDGFELDTVYHNLHTHPPIKPSVPLAYVADQYKRRGVPPESIVNLAVVEPAKSSNPRGRPRKGEKNKKHKYNGHRESEDKRLLSYIYSLDQVLKELNKRDVLIMKISLIEKRLAAGDGSAPRSSDNIMCSTDPSLDALLKRGLDEILVDDDDDASDGLEQQKKKRKKTVKTVLQGRKKDLVKELRAFNAIIRNRQHSSDDDLEAGVTAYRESILTWKHHYQEKVKEIEKKRTSKKLNKLEVAAEALVLPPDTTRITKPLKNVA